MDDIRLFLDLDMNGKLRKALTSISAFIHAANEIEAVRELEKVIGLLQDIHQGFLDRTRIRDD